MMSVVNFRNMLQIVFQSPCEICDAFDNVIEKFSHYLGKLQAAKHHEVYIHNEVYLPTTVSLLSNGHDESVSNNNNEDNTVITYRPEKDELSRTDKRTFGNTETVTRITDNRKQNKDQFKSVDYKRDLYLPKD